MAERRLGDWIREQRGKAPATPTTPAAPAVAPADPAAELAAVLAVFRSLVPTPGDRTDPRLWSEQAMVERFRARVRMQELSAALGRAMPRLWRPDDEVRG